MLDCSQSSKGRSHAMFPASTPEGKGGIARAAAMETKVERTHTGHFFRFNIRLRVDILLFFLSVWGELP